MMWQSMKKISPKKTWILRSLGQNEEYVRLPDIRWDVAMETALIQKLRTKN